jgi:hypothetical protein
MLTSSCLVSTASLPSALCPSTPYVHYWMLPHRNNSSFLNSDLDASTSFPCFNTVSFRPVEPSSQDQPEHPWLPSVTGSASDVLSNLHFPAPIMTSPSTFSPSHTTDISKSLRVNDSACHADFFRTHSGNLSSRQQSSLSQQRRVLLRRRHSETNVPSVPAQTSSHFHLSSAIEEQYQKQWRSPQRGVTPVVPSHNSAAFSADRRSNTAHSAARAIPNRDYRHAGPLHGATATTHNATRGELFESSLSPSPKLPFVQLYL